MNADTKTSILSVEQVSLKASIGSAYLLKDISFEVKVGDRLTIIGPSGAGKTSLLRVLNRLNEPTGRITLEGQDYRNIPIIQLRRRVMLAMQEPKLLGMTVREALSYPLILRGDKPPEIQQRLISSMEQLHIPEDWLGRTELELSVGQRQLVAIARALIIQPQILLLDEPTSALDVGRANHVLQVLTQLTTTAQLTVIMVNHQLDLAQSFSTRVLYLQSGEVIQDTPATQINWTNLRQQLIQAEAQAAEEWS